jgi:hypothetical protein
MSLFADRYLVPDLAPHDREEFPPSWRARYVFVAESPHVSEVTPDARSERRPLCGAAGRVWWSLLTELAEGQPNPDTSRDRLLGFCISERIAILNAVQFPLDPKVTREFPDADPIKVLRFCKEPGAQHYKKCKERPELLRSLDSLRKRLAHPAFSAAEIFCLGNDSEWFMKAALGAEEFARMRIDKIPHPSAWWRRGGYYGQVARQKLAPLFDIKTKRPAWTTSPTP